MPVEVSAVTSLRRGWVTVQSPQLISACSQPLCPLLPAALQVGVQTTSPFHEEGTLAESRETTGVEGYPGVLCRGSESSFGHPYPCGEQRWRHSCSLPPPPPHTLSVPPEDTELKVSQNLAQESEKCCWAHVPKLGQFPHPPATSLGLRSRGPLHYVPRPRPVPWLLCQQGGYFQPNRVIY